MALHTVTFQPGGQTASVATGTLLTEAVRQAGLDIGQPCGGQGRCGRCAVIVANGQVRRRSAIRLSAADLEAGYALACQTVVEGEAVVRLLETEQVEHRLVTDKAARKVAAPFAYDPAQHQTVRAFPLVLDAPTLSDSVDDLARLERGLAAHGVRGLEVALPLLRTLGQRLREADWQVTAIVETDTWRRPDGPPRLIELLPGAGGHHRPYGLAIDIGTTTVTVYLVDLASGEALDQAAEYNGQIARGEDVISRIIYAGKGGSPSAPAGLAELRELVLATSNALIARLTERNDVSAQHIYKATVAGNPTMLHLFLGLPPGAIRLSPYIPTVNLPQPITAAEAGLAIHPHAAVDPLPGVASYVGADITAGVLAAGLAEAEPLTLFIDVGTNGEIVLGNREWLMTCACSAGPAFEGAGVVSGMRATRGAIEEVWINSQTYEPTYRVIGGGPPRGLCGSGLISLLAELFITGVADKGGNLNVGLSPRVRAGEHGPEYVVAWAGEAALGRDIVITKVDIDNLLRAKAAIYAGFNVLAQSVGLELSQVERLLIGGSFGKYINVEKAVQIGLLPDMAWDRFQFLGNTAAMGAYLALLSREARAAVRAAAEKMTYLELSADNTFYDAFTSALFLPHTDLDRFPSVAALVAAGRAPQTETAP
ncbi:MAG: DUF4445 domain-containing protein [Anaerolineales bacterium]|nr:DUF4445 domain-containing protein [Anaerolineales bacterium]